MTVPPPPDPFRADAESLEAGALLYRLGSNHRAIAEFNPGVGRATRFAFFGDPVVPVLYAADTEQGALAESLLHDVPTTGGRLTYDAYADSVMGRLVVRRALRLASLRGLGLRRLGVSARELTDTEASGDPRTVAWAAAAHSAGFDGLAWTSRLCNDTRAVVLFGDRCGDAISRTRPTGDCSRVVPGWTG